MKRHTLSLAGGAARSFELARSGPPRRGLANDQLPPCSPRTPAPSCPSGREPARPRVAPREGRRRSAANDQGAPRSPLPANSAAAASSRAPSPRGVVRRRRKAGAGASTWRARRRVKKRRTPQRPSALDGERSGPDALAANSGAGRVPPCRGARVIVRHRGKAAAGLNPRAIVAAGAAKLVERQCAAASVGARRRIALAANFDVNSGLRAFIRAAVRPCAAGRPPRASSGTATEKRACYRRGERSEARRATARRRPSAPDAVRSKRVHPCREPVRHRAAPRKADAGTLGRYVHEVRAFSRARRSVRRRSPANDQGAPRSSGNSTDSASIRAANSRGVVRRRSKAGARRRTINCGHARRELRRSHVHPRRLLSWNAWHRAAPPESRRGPRSGATSANCLCRRAIDAPRTPPASCGAAGGPAAGALGRFVREQRAAASVAARRRTIKAAALAESAGAGASIRAADPRGQVRRAGRPWLDGERSRRVTLAVLAENSGAVAPSVPRSHASCGARRPTRARSGAAAAKRAILSTPCPRRGGHGEG